MLKIIALFILIISVLILSMAMDQSFINKLKQDRYFDHLATKKETDNSLYHKIFIRSDHWRYGDLYGLSFLHQFKYKLEAFKKFPGDPKAPATGRNLYIIGDSYLADKQLDGAFKQFDKVMFLDNRFPYGPITLDSTKKNFLILEFAERNLNDYRFKKTTEIKWTPAEIQLKVNFKPVASNPPAENLSPNLLQRLGKIIFNPDLNRNLELLLFDYNVWTPIKESKAFVNYKILGYLPKEVIVSSNKERLLMNATVDVESRQSAFRVVNNWEIKNISKNLESAQKYYLSIGFQKVFLSVVPNPVSLYDAKRSSYNHLLERIEQNNQFDTIDLMNIYRSASTNLYYKSDTHWNPQGLNIWINQVNRTFAKEIK